MPRNTILFLLVAMLSGCTTRYEGPSMFYPSGQTCLVVTRQGSIPVSAVYRDVWPVSPVITITNEPKSRFLTMPVIGTIISTVANVYGAVSGSRSGDCYTYRDDIVIVGVTNITPENVRAILDELVIPHGDAQRPAWLPADSVRVTR